jgi:hypothetical protein
MEIYNRYSGNFIIEVGDTRIDLRGADLSEAYLRGADLYKADLSGTDLSEADLRGADLYKADLSGTDLSEADLSEADLREADLSGASLRGANLRGVSLRGADLCGTFFDIEIIFFQFNKHILQKIGNEIRIGCAVHSLRYWKDNYVDIGEKHCYTKEEIERYGKFINMFDE